MPKLWPRAVRLSRRCAILGPSARTKWCWRSSKPKSRRRGGPADTVWVARVRSGAEVSWLKLRVPSSDSHVGHRRAARIMCSMAAPTDYTEAELEFLGLATRWVKRLRAQQRTRRLTRGELDMLLAIGRTTAELQSTHGG